MFRRIADTNKTIVRIVSTFAHTDANAPNDAKLANESFASIVNLLLQ